jgi:hypothetical protein
MLQKTGHKPSILQAGTSKGIAEWVDTKIQSQKNLHAKLSKLISLDLPPLHSYREEWIDN